MNTPSPRSRLFIAALLVGFAFARPAVAQTPVPGAAGGPATGPSSFNLTIATSYSDSSQQEGRGVDLGEVSVAAYEVRLGSSLALAAKQRLAYGLDFGHFRLDRDATVPLPTDLRELSLPLGFMAPISDNWSANVMVRPGVYGTSLDFSGHEFNAPVLAMATYRQSPTLTWMLGVRYDAWSEYEVLPLAGVNWKFAPDWEFSIGLPRTGVSWQFHRSAILRVGATAQGGSFHVANDPRPSTLAAPALGDTKLDYREIRVGAALDLFSNERLAMLLDAGAIVNQRFEYDQRDYSISGDTAAYVSVSMRLRF